MVEIRRQIGARVPAERPRHEQVQIAVDAVAFELRDEVVEANRVAPDRSPRSGSTVVQMRCIRAAVHVHVMEAHHVDAEFLHARGTCSASAFSGKFATERHVDAPEARAPAVTARWPSGVARTTLSSAITRARCLRCPPLFHCRHPTAARHRTARPPPDLGPATVNAARRRQSTTNGIARRGNTHMRNESVRKPRAHDRHGGAGSSERARRARSGECLILQACLFDLYRAMRSFSSLVSSSRLGHGPRALNS